MPLFRALAKNMAPMTNADESPTNRLTLFPIYLSLFIVSTLCPYCQEMLILEREENRSTRRKTLEAQERSTTRTQLTWNTTPDLVSVVTGTTR